MIVTNDFFHEEIKKSLAKGGVGVIPTDTLYGLVGSAASFEAVERIYELKKRDLSKPLIVLISDFEDLEKFDIDLDTETKEILEKAWPGPVSVILPVPSESFDYLTRGSGSIAFRLPQEFTLREFIREVGPIVAPSANPEGIAPAKNIEEAQGYFGDGAEFYIEGGELAGEPSALIEVKNGKINVLRGEFTISS